ncbi:TetR/AcrR family transcriptional regulator [Deinococcus misasensis]|uniref:TetR/AcrR family transcriptional regulator n=1 Tax=Deinococcus misasensis TaxID=392413 RepID=UPI0005536B4E|nr:TetR/AcrR family transcriptional regulator [Deinococcus misasensis]
MGRKDLSHIRKEEILDAFERCILEQGLEKATLQRTAEVAKVNLGTIHHYIGKKDAMLRLLTERLMQRARAGVAELQNALPPEQRWPALLQAFFPADTDPTNRILTELVKSSEKSPDLQAFLLDINTLYSQLISEELHTQHPELSPEQANQIAFAVLALSYGGDVLVGLGLPSTRRDRLPEMVQAWISHPTRR